MNPRYRLLLLALLALLVTALICWQLLRPEPEASPEETFTALVAAAAMITGRASSVWDPLPDQRAAAMRGALPDRSQHRAIPV